MASDALHGLFVALTGQAVPDARQLRNPGPGPAAYAEAPADHVVYAHRMLVTQLVAFVWEWSLTLVTAVFDPARALLRQAYLRALYRMILTSSALWLTA
ncbi:hypothetical protein ACIQAC_03140 [Streptomyces sp. NPDC088387]|uniref:hypothetical protein n=1 Tax=Streptomyces sp. NPDC088387 TaxID=3365859 RepID=UPI0037FB6F04